MGDIEKYKNVLISYDKKIKILLEKQYQNNRERDKITRIHAEIMEHLQDEEQLDREYLFALLLSIHK